ncbi:5-(carboxyamino)imidazole ribonucleotide mutase [Oxyplasma meridianum]|uniref:N5-carboxyaminoimidazole ribonucleotide mutase n=1 Tax=Oxyplasma meridianum TaxID=3073602 RepID=A0AAX4NHZ2_9ARCH
MPKVGVIMGSRSDYEYMSEAATTLTEFGVDFEQKIISAHRTPQEMYDYARTARENGIEVIIAGAGGSAHLPGMTASMTDLPVIGVPVPTRHLKGMDSLLSIVQMPSGIPVATVAIGNSRNAAILAVRILSIKYPDLATKLKEFSQSMRNKVLADKLD